MTESHGQNSALIYMDKPFRIALHDYKMLITRNGTILTLHVIPNRKLHANSFQMA